MGTRRTSARPLFSQVTTQIPAIACSPTAELGQYTLHGLRHFTATQLGAVAEAATVHERMGHGSLTLSSIYTHRVSAADRAAAEHMGRVLDEP